VITVGLEQVSGEAMLEVLDVAGRTVYTTNLDRTMQGQAIVDLSGLAAGDYSLMLRHAEGRQTTRLVIQ
jgi:hypothetical protein